MMIPELRVALPEVSLERACLLLEVSRSFY